jgi:D-cysteine desulfhydrase
MTTRSATTHDAQLPALFRHEPALARTIAWLPIGTFPTAVDKIHLAGVGPVYIKRDDRCAEGYAGNKIRKLEFLLADARAAGVRRLITVGAAGSHHALATAYHGTRNGFAVTLVLFPQPLTDHVRDIVLMDHAVGAKLRWVGRMQGVPMALWRTRLAHRAEQPRVIAPGGSDATGTLGYVSAALELATQLRDGALSRPSRIHVAAGTLGTAAGIAIGLAWAGLDIPIVATRITSRIVTNQRALTSLVRRTVALLKRAGATPPDVADALRLVELRHDQIGHGYGHGTPQAQAAAERLGRAGLKLDMTYTAKAVAGLIAAAGVPAAPVDGPPLFWQTLSAVEPRELLTDVSPEDLPAPFAAYLGTEAR